MTRPLDPDPRPRPLAQDAPRTPIGREPQTRCDRGAAFVLGELNRVLGPVVDRLFPPLVFCVGWTCRRCGARYDNQTVRTFLFSVCPHERKDHG